MSGPPVAGSLGRSGGKLPGRSTTTHIRRVLETDQFWHPHGSDVSPALSVPQRQPSPHLSNRLYSLLSIYQQLSAPDEIRQFDPIFISEVSKLWKRHVGQHVKKSARLADFFTCDYTSLLDRKRAFHSLCAMIADGAVVLKGSYFVRYKLNGLCRTLFNLFGGDIKLVNF